MERDARILIVDDSTAIQEYIRATIEQMADFSGHWFVAGNGKEALDVLNCQPIDLVLCDVVMPEMDGFAFLEMMKSKPKYADIPVIMLTAEESVEKKVQGLNLGASDYLVKPFDESELIARVRVQLKIKQLQDDLKKANKRYRRLSITDPLTRLYNRRYFLDILSKEFARADRYKVSLSLIMLDIDRFKEVNDELGHAQGDRVLTELSKLIKRNIRHHDVLARYGGEEFVILLPAAGREETKRVAGKLLELVGAHRFPGLKKRGVTVSMGICSYPGRGVKTIDHLIALADRSMYRAKESGRNRVAEYSHASMDGHA